MQVKICPSCGLENAPSESFCTRCDFDLLSVPAQTVAARAADSVEVAAPLPPAAPVAPIPARCRLELVDDPTRSFVMEAGQTIGRGLEADVLLCDVPHMDFISRRHAKFLRRGEQWFVQYIAQGNFIAVDGETVEDDSEVALHDGSLLSLSLTAFRVAIEGGISARP